ncbi:MAG: hypothetical protein KF718_06275 [Polyangiaceae bacterium]|nr:hypothetical protein [Polyangiaceae bacterium]
MQAVRSLDVTLPALSDPTRYRAHLPSDAARTILKRFNPDRKTWKVQAGLTERAIEEQFEKRWERGTLYRELGVRLADPDADHIQRRQVCTPNSNIDLLGYQEGKRMWWVFEIKQANSSRSAVAQVLGYTNWIREQHAKRSEDVQPVVLTDRTSGPLLGAAKESNVQVWTYSAEAVLAGQLEFSRAV